ncbi:MAG: hypothetical protein JXL80_10665 [Planctomycetes bacterium]|nr:hypothetical protein [Planctomycetota bacterium]
MKEDSEAFLFMKRSCGYDMDRPFWMQLYREYVYEIAEGRPEFIEELRQTAIESLASEDTTWVRKGIHALAVVGQAEDIPLVKPLVTHGAPLVARDAKTCLWELEHRAC